MVESIGRRLQPKSVLTCLFKTAVWAMCLVAPWAQAGKDDEIIAATKQCIYLEERRRGLPHGLLLAIAKTESGLNWRAINYNRDGSYDIGVMQINSRHLPRLRKYGITQESLWNPCVNVSVGAFILHEFIAMHGLSWKAVAAYNTGSPERKPAAARRYAEKVHQNYIRIALGTKSQ